MSSKMALIDYLQRYATKVVEERKDLAQTKEAGKKEILKAKSDQKTLQKGLG